MSKIAGVSRLLSRSGMMRALESLPTRPGLIVFNHHRVGDRTACAYDRDLFSASAEQLEDQLDYIRKHLPVITPQELAEFMDAKKRFTRMHAMITFDDGYLDNYTLAFPILKAFELRAVFYLVSTFVGSNAVPWWDEVSWLVRHASEDAEKLDLPRFGGGTVELKADRDEALRQVLRVYKAPQNSDPVGMLQYLREACGVTLPVEGRRFLNWNEAHEMAAAGMEMGAHTHTHPILGRLPVEEQRWELTECKRILDANLATPVRSLAYPNGGHGDFNADTERLAEEAGLTTGFSFFGGVNGPDGGERYNVRRLQADTRPAEFRLKMLLTTRMGLM